jgi:hypothetical protein
LGHLATERPFGTMLKSTFGGFKYWGNTPYREYNNFENQVHSMPSLLPRRDQLIIYFLNREFFNKFKYKKIEFNLIEKMFFPFYFLLPMKDEFIFIKENIFKFNLKFIKFIFFYLPKRLFLFTISIFNNFSNRY